MSPPSWSHAKDHRLSAGKVDGHPTVSPGEAEHGVIPGKEADQSPGKPIN